MSGAPSGSGGRNRFWTSVSVEPSEAGFRILLDNRPLRLPSGAMLLLPTRILADAVATEWAEAGGGATGGTFGPDTLLFTRLAGTMQERVAPEPAALVATLLGYAGSDVLCYRAAHPAELAARQDRAWQPWLDWCAGTHGARLLVTEGIMPVTQPAEAIAALRRALESRDATILTGLGVIVPSLGSLVLGLAIGAGALSDEAAVELATLDERYQSERWGTDAEASERALLMRQEVSLATRFLRLAGPPDG